MLFGGGSPCFQGSYGDQLAVVLVTGRNRCRPWNGLGVDEGVVDLGEVVQRLYRCLQLCRQLVVRHEVQHLKETAQPSV